MKGNNWIRPNGNGRWSRGRSEIVFAKRMKIFCWFKEIILPNTPTHSDRSLLSNYNFFLVWKWYDCRSWIDDCRYQFACGQNKPFSMPIIIIVNYVVKWFSTLFKWYFRFIFSPFQMNDDIFFLLLIRLKCFGEIKIFWLKCHCAHFRLMN